MWHAIRDILLSPNVTILGSFLVFVLLLGVVLSKTGLLTIHTEAVSVGAANKERDIIRQQVEWARMHFDAMENSMPKPDNYDAWRGKYVAERVYDEYVEWIVFNHFNKSPAYIEIKQDRVISLVHNLTKLEYFHSEEFEQFLREDTKQSIEKLIQIRNVYK